MTNELRQGLGEIMKADAVDQWFNTTNKAFNNQKPSEIVRQGQEAQLWRMIHFLGAGLPT
jgi:hypothetical protein